MSAHPFLLRHDALEQCKPLATFAARRNCLKKNPVKRDESMPFSGATQKPHAGSVFPASAARN